MTTYSNNLRLTLIGTGEQAGVWGTTTNVNLGTLLEAAISGVIGVPVTSTLQALTAYEGAADQARQAVIVLTGTPGGTATVCLPPANKTYIIKNATNQIVVISAATSLGGTTLTGGTTVAIPVNKTTTIVCDAVNVQGGLNYIPDDLSVLGDATFSGDGAFGGTGSLKVPTGTTAERAGTGIRFNTDLATYEGYDVNSSTWGAIGGGGGGGATGGGLNKAFFENQTEITASYTISTGYNAMTAGPITIVPLEFEGSITATTLTVPTGGVTSGVLYAGAIISGTGVAVPTTIVRIISGSGGAGTYEVTPSQSVGTTTFTSNTTVTVPVGSNWVVVSGEHP